MQQFHERQQRYGAHAIHGSDVVTANSLAIHNGPKRDTKSGSVLPGQKKSHTEPNKNSPQRSALVQEARHISSRTSTPMVGWGDAERDTTPSVGKLGTSTAVTVSPVVATLDIPLQQFSSPIPPRRVLLPPVHSHTSLTKTDVDVANKRQAGGSSLDSFFSGNFRPPSNALVDYKEVPETLAELQRALHHAVVSEIAAAESPARRRGMEVTAREKRDVDCKAAAAATKSVHSFFGALDPPLASPTPLLSERAFVEMPPTEAVGSSHTHLLFQERMDFEEDLLYATFGNADGANDRHAASGTSAGLCDPQEHPSSVCVPATLSFLTHLHMPAFSQHRVIEAEDRRVDEGAASPVRTLEDADTDNLFWKNIVTPAGSASAGIVAHTARAFSLPETLIHFSSANASDTAAQQQATRAEQRNAVIQRILEDKRRAAIQAALAMGPEHLPAPPKKVTLRLIKRTDCSLTTAKLMQSFEGSVFLDTCVFDPLTSVTMEQLSGKPLPKREDESKFLKPQQLAAARATPARRKSYAASLLDGSSGALSTAGVTPQRQRLSRMHGVPLPDLAFYHQVKKFVTVAVCPECRGDPIAAAYNEVFISVSSPSSVHRTLMERVALNIQHYVNTQQHPHYSACHVVEGPSDHAIECQRESPRDKDLLEMLLLDDASDSFSIDDRPAVLGKWEQYAKELAGLYRVQEDPLPEFFVELAGAFNLTSKQQHQADALDAALSPPTVAQTLPTAEDALEISLLSTSSGPKLDFLLLPTEVTPPDDRLAGSKNRSSLSLDTNRLSMVEQDDAGGAIPFFAFSGKSERGAAKRRENAATPTNETVQTPGGALQSPFAAKTPLRSGSTVASPLASGSTPAPAPQQAFQRRSSVAPKGFGEAVKTQRLRRLESLRSADGQGDEFLNNFMDRVGKGIPIAPGAALPDDRKPSLGGVSGRKAMAASSSDSDDETLLSKKPILQAETVTKILDVFKPKRASNLKLTKQWGSAETPVPEGSIITGRKKNRKGLSLDEILRLRLEELFCRYGLAVAPKPGALSEQSLHSLRRCSGCVFERPHAFCTQCGFLFCVDCFYFVHRPRNETFMWYAAQNPGRLRSLVSTEFMSESGNDFRHAALSIESLFRVALQADNYVPVLPTASAADVSTKVARTAKVVLDQFRTTCAQKESHPLATLSGGGLSDEEFHLSIENVVGQLKDRLKHNFAGLATSEEFAKIASETGDTNNNAQKKAAKRKTRKEEQDEQTHLIQSAIDAFTPSQLSHILEVVAKFQLKVPPLVYRIVMGHDNEEETQKTKAAQIGDSKQSKAEVISTSRRASNAHQQLGETEGNSTTDVVDETSEVTDVSRYELDDDDVTTEGDGNAPKRSLLDRKTSRMRDAIFFAKATQQGVMRRAASQVLSHQSKLTAVLERKRRSLPQEEPISLFYDEDEAEKSRRLSRAVDPANFANVPDHLQVVPLESSVVDKGPSKEEVQASFLQELRDRGEHERAAWLTSKITEQSTTTNGNVILVVVSAFADSSLLPLDSADDEAIALSGALRSVGCSVDTMHSAAKESFLFPTYRNVVDHIQLIQRAVIVLDEDASKQFTVVVLSRGFVAKCDAAFTADSYSPGAKPHFDFVALAADSAFTPDDRVSTSNVITPGALQQCRDAFDRPPLVMMDCWPVQNATGAVDEEGVGFGLVLGRNSLVDLESSPVSPVGLPSSPEGSPTQQQPPGSIAVLSADAPEAVSAAAAAKVEVKAIRLAFTYHPKQGGLLVYYVLRALEGRVLFSRVVMSSPSHTAKRAFVDAKKKSSSVDRNITMIDLFVFVGQRVEVKGVRFLLDDKAVADVPPPTTTASEGKKKKTLDEKKDNSKWKAVSSFAVRSTASKAGSPTTLLSAPSRNGDNSARPLSPGSIFYSQSTSSIIASRRDQLVKSSTQAASDDANLPVISFPIAVADRIMHASLTSSGNPFVAAKSQETIFDLSESRRFHFTMWVRTVELSGASLARDKSFEESTVFNAKWRRVMLEQLQSLVNGSRGVTRNGRPLQMVGIRAETNLILDFGAGWAADSTSISQIQRLVRSSCAEAESMIGLSDVFEVKIFTHSGVVLVTCPSDEYRWVLTETLVATERKAAMRGTACPSVTTYVPLTFSLLGTERDFRRAKKIQALQATGGSGHIVVRVEKDMNPEALHYSASRIQSLYRGARCRFLLKSMMDVGSREERIRASLEGQAFQFYDALASDIHLLCLAEVSTNEIGCRIVLVSQEVEGFVNLIEDVKELIVGQEKIARNEVKQVETRSWLRMFEAPNRWFITDDENTEWTYLLNCHRHAFKESWQRYYLILEEHQDRVKLRTEARSYVALMPRILRMPHFHTIPSPPCDFDFASSLVVFPANFKRLYNKVKRSVELVDTNNSGLEGSPGPSGPSLPMRSLFDETA